MFDLSKENLCRFIPERAFLVENRALHITTCFLSIAGKQLLTKESCVSFAPRLRDLNFLQHLRDSPAFFSVGGIGQLEYDFATTLYSSEILDFFCIISFSISEMDSQNFLRNL